MALGPTVELPPLLRLMTVVWRVFVKNAAKAEDHRRLAEFVGILSTLDATFGESGEFRAQASMVFRKAGLLKDALAWAQRAYAAAPNFLSALAVANSFRDQGALEDYLRWIEITVGHESDGCSALLDLSDALIGASRYGDAASGSFTPRLVFATPRAFRPTPSCRAMRATIPTT